MKLIKTAGADSAYDISLLYQALVDIEIRLHTPGAAGGVNYKIEIISEAFEFEKEKVKEVLWN